MVLDCVTKKEEKREREREKIYSKRETMYICVYIIYIDVKNQINTALYSIYTHTQADTV